MDGRAPCFESELEGAAARAEVDLNLPLSRKSFTDLEDQLVKDSISAPVLAWDDGEDLKNSHDQLTLPFVDVDIELDDKQVVAYPGEEGGPFHDSYLGLSEAGEQPKVVPATCGRIGSAMICLTDGCNKRLDLEQGKIPFLAGYCRQAEDEEFNGSEGSLSA